MRLNIAIKDHNGKPYNLPERYEFAPEELDKLAADFSNYCSANGEQPTRKGGAYKCNVGSEEKMLFLKFDELVYIG
ncbi:MAG: hypothetical protein HC879_08855 [Leptolyngbyaceae cyanobacterium SL_5_9]|nr:hypothetical protein [Leptolyngbyaceae cyanobacterium SL_5_9]NJO72828.1 hypothetical protein [Leptolyngbyaceae cyanobacterium RM1_406_9]